jgi:hypothetical protein
MTRRRLPSLYGVQYSVIQRGAEVPKRMTPKLVQAFADQSWAYQNFSPGGRLHLVCPHCRALVILFENLKPTDRSQIATLWRLRGSGTQKAIEMLRNVSGCDLLQAKANVLHIRVTDSRCHKCQHLVPRGALLCSQCMSVNLDW